MSAEQRFAEAFEASLQFHNYGWSAGKDISMRWVASQVVGPDVLDVGGTVQLLKHLAKSGVRASIFDGFPVSGLAPDEVDKTYVGDFSALLDTVGERKFDTITCRHSLEHTMNPTFVLWQMNQLLKERGRLIVILPPYHKYWVWFYTHFNCVPEENWEMLFFRTGFKLVTKAHGQWDDEQSRPEFKETRYVLESETKEIRLGDRPG